MFADEFDLTMEQNVFKAGYGKIKITPPLGLELCGFGYYLERKASAVRADLYATALYLESDGANSQLLINCDLIGLRREISEQVRHSLVALLGLAEENIMLTAAHTHTGPATYDATGCGKVDETYVAALPALLVEAAAAAHADARQVTGTTTFDVGIDPIGFNRVSDGGFVDNHVRGFNMKRKGAPDLCLINYGCHPVSYSASPEISPDFPGLVVEKLAAEGIDTLFINGPCGDIDPLIRQAGSPSLEKVDEVVDGYANRIIAAFQRSIKPQTRNCEISRQGKRLLNEYSTPLNADSNAYEPPIWKKLVFDVDVPLQIMDEDQINQAVADIETSEGKDSPFAVVVHHWRSKWLGHLQAIAKDRSAGWLMAAGSDKPYAERARIHVMSLGQILLVGVPYEVFTRLRTLLAESFPEKIVLVAGNTDSTLGYLAGEDTDNHSYEALLSSYLYQRLPPAAGALEMLAREITRHIKDMLT